MKEKGQVLPVLQVEQLFQIITGSFHVNSTTVEVTSSELGVYVGDGRTT